MNLAQTSNSVIFMITISILTGEKLENCKNPKDICLPYYVIPVHYHVKLTDLYMGKYDSDWAKLLNIKDEYDSFNFYGESSTTINILQSTQYIKLHGLRLHIINQSNITLIKNSGIIYAQKEFTETFETNLLEFYFPDMLYPGLYTFKMEFLGHLTENSTKSFFKSFYANDGNSTTWLIASHIQANGARRLFPCWDEPHLKATFTISIKKYHNFAILSNMPEQIQISHVFLSSDTSNFIWTHFYTTPPMSTFQIAIVITNYPRMRISKNISLWCEICSDYNQPLKFEFATRIIENITLHMQSEFRGINIPKMDHVVLPYFLPDGTSKWGLIFHREADLFYDEQLDPIMREMEVARLIASKIAYQWFSNVFSSSWSHIWLHVGLVILYAEKAIVKILNNPEIMDFFIVQSHYESLYLNDQIDMNPVQVDSLSEIDSIFHFPSYIKVLIVLRMYQSDITDEVFWENVYTYLYKHTFSSMIPYEIWPTIGEKLPNTNPYYMSDEILKWMKFKYYPILFWTQETFSSGKIEQRDFNASYGKWWLPISITKQFLYPRISKIRLTSQKPYIYFNQTEEEGWILIDVKQSGYYRINYDSENWHKIIHYLKSGQYENISVINRAKIIDDAFHMSNISEFWEVTKYLSQETNYVAWYPMIEVFEYMSSVLPFPSHIHIKEKFRELLDKPLKMLGFHENVMDNEFTKCLRQEIVKWACTLDHPDCAIEARHKLNHYFQNPEQYPVLSECEQWTFCKGLSTAHFNMWDKLNVILSRKPDDKFLSFLVCCRVENYTTSENLQYLFDQFTSDENQNIAVIRSHINIFYSVIMKCINTPYILDNLLLNLPKIKPDEINKLAALTVIINNIYNVEFIKNDILRKIEILRFTALRSMIQQKLLKRNLEIEKHENYFRIMNV